VRTFSRVQERRGLQALDFMGPLFVGTIHSYCFRLLQGHVPKYETYDVLDDNRFVGFLTRESPKLHIKDLNPKLRLFASIRAFLENLDVVENELLL
jgi:DNA helicase II / ATP-dependent DNA helicase PcrA